MKTYHFIIFIICLCHLCTNPSASNITSNLINVPLAVFQQSLEKTIEVVQNVSSTMSTMHVDHDQNFINAILYCSDLLDSTAHALNWSLSTSHDLKGFCTPFSFSFWIS